MQVKNAFTGWYWLLGMIFQYLSKKWAANELVAEQYLERLLSRQTKHLNAASDFSVYPKSPDSCFSDISHLLLSLVTAL